MKMADIDVTAAIITGAIDGELLPLLKCVCGHRFPAWLFVLGIDRENATMCPSCSRELYFRGTISVFEVQRGNDD